MKNIILVMSLFISLNIFADYYQGYNVGFKGGLNLNNVTLINDDASFEDEEYKFQKHFFIGGTLKFDYYLNDTPILKTYLSKPQTVNPFNYNSPVSKNPKVYVEDIKGFYIMNLPSATNQSDSDDWTLTSIQVTMDDNSLIPVQPDIVSNYYDIKIDVPNMEFGDDLTDILGSLYSFNSFVGDRYPYMTKYVQVILPIT